MKLIMSLLAAGCGWMNTGAAIGEDCYCSIIILCAHHRVLRAACCAAGSRQLKGDNGFGFNSNAKPDRHKILING